MRRVQDIILNKLKVENKTSYQSTNIFDDKDKRSNSCIQVNISRYESRVLKPQRSINTKIKFINERWSS